MEIKMNFVFQIELEQILGLNQDLAPSSYIAQTESGNNKNKVSTHQNLVFCLFVFGQSVPFFHW